MKKMEDGRWKMEANAVASQRSGLPSPEGGLPSERSERSSISRYVPWALVKMDEGWSIPDDVLKHLWYVMSVEDKVRSVFYDGHINTCAAWLEFIKDPLNLAVIIVDNERKEPVIIAWINGLRHGTAQLHFCVLGKYHRGAAEAVMDYWSAWPDGAGGRLLKVLVGITPETHFTALKLVRLVGFTIMGTIPNFCDLVYEGKRVGAVISYYLPEAVASKRSGLPSEAVFPVSEANDLPSISKGGA